jgi:hypothetical protein
MSATGLDPDPRCDGDLLLAAFVDDVRRCYAVGPAPTVGPALAEVLATGTGTASAPTTPAALPERAAGGFVAWLSGRRPRLALGAAVASLTFLGVGAAGALPGPAQLAFERAADAVGVRLPATVAPEPPAPVVTDPEGPAGAPGREGGGHGREAGIPPASVPPVGGGVDNLTPAAADDRQELERDREERPGAGESSREAGGPSREPGGPAEDVPASRPAEPDRPGSEPASPGAPGRPAGGRPAAGGHGGAGEASTDRPAPAEVRSRYGSAWHRSFWSPPRSGATEGSPEEEGRPRGTRHPADERPARPYPSTAPRR